MDLLVEVRLPLGPEAAYAARRSVEAVSPYVKPRALEELKLLVSELVTNSVKHVRVESQEDRWVGLRVNSLPDGIQLEVTDPGPGFDPSKSRERHEYEGGWGLKLLNRFATRWEVFHDGVNNHVVFEIKGPWRRSSSR